MKAIEKLKLISAINLDGDDLSSDAGFLQMIYMIIAGYFGDDTSDELTNDPVFKAVLNEDTLITNDHFKIS